jgi:MFS family permease
MSGECAIGSKRENTSICSTLRRVTSKSAISRQRCHAVTTLLPILFVVLVAFFVVGMALPILPLHVHHELGFGTFEVGLVTGCQFVASLISRVWAGRYADARGAKRAVVACCSRR